MQKINIARLKTLGDENIINQRKDSLMKLKMEPQIQKNITIISISYNSTDVIEKMLASVPKDITLVVVDNGSDDGHSLIKWGVFYIVPVLVFKNCCNPIFSLFDNHFTRNISQTFWPSAPNANAFGNLKPPIVHP